MKRLGARLACLSLSVALYAQGQCAGKIETPQSDRTILYRLHKHAQFVIAASLLAEERCQTPDVKEFGERLEKDYKVADLKVRALAGRLGVKFKDNKIGQPPDPRLTLLESAPIAEFDQRFVRAIARRHAAIIPAMEHQIGLLPKEGLIYDLLDQVLPVMREHYQTATTLGHAPK